MNHLNVTIYVVVYSGQHLARKNDMFGRSVASKREPWDITRKVSGAPRAAQKIAKSRESFCLRAPLTRAYLALCRAWKKSDCSAPPSRWGELARTPLLISRNARVAPFTAS